VQFAVALALVDRSVTLSQFSDEKVRQPEIIAVMQKVKTIVTAELRQTEATGRSQIVEINLKDGRQLVKRCDFAPGTLRNPLSDEELVQKYRSCASLVLPERETEQSIELIMNLERIGEISKLLALVTSPSSKEDKE